MSFNPIDLIRAKRDGEALSPDDVKALVDAYTHGQVEDYQMSAFLMAAMLRGMGDAETTALTDAMLHSGEVVDLSDVPGAKVDKHSTGGVGDKISIILAPIVAACGVPVPMISGRGLGHTGGTLDKLESIPGFRTDLTMDAYRRQLRDVGLVMMGQTEEIAPADRKLYGLRDVTATVEFIPFIAASIMSKKLAEGIDGLVLDVKCGQGAFMRDEADARRLAEALANVGERFGKETVAWLTDMNAPLGYAAGNWPEIVESVACLRGEDIPDVMTVTYALAGEMLRLGGKAASWEEGREQARHAVASGRAFDRFLQMVRAQGGDASRFEDAGKPLAAEPVDEVVAPDDAAGYVASIDAYAIGLVVRDMGAGRLRMDDTVDPGAGLILMRKPGDPVAPGDALAHLQTRRTHRLDEYRARVRDAFHFSAHQPAPRPILIDRYTGGAWGT